MVGSCWRWMFRRGCVRTPTRVLTRSFCHAFGGGEGKHQMVPGWPYSVVAALETGRTSWTAVLDAIRLEPGADVAAVTTVQIREVVERLVAAGQWRPGDPKVLVVLDAGYDAPRIAHLLAGLPIEILGRLRSDRVMRRPAPSRNEFHLANPQRRPAAQARRRVRLRRPHNLGHRAGRDDHGHPALWEGDRAGVGPVAPVADPPGRMARPRRAAAPHRGHRHPPGRGEAAQRWGQQAALAVVVAHGRHRSGRRPLLAVLLAPLRHRLHAKTGSPAGAPKPSCPGPGRPPGSKNQRPAPRHDVGRVLATGEAHARPAHHKVGTRPRRGN
ncbi:transposase [Streptomyces sp. ME19-01-6]|uniref:transposase n=1 Tax=Streptomyces sp. ME19-01-6 TaxID=3028686 RepID=UPI0039F5784F